MYSRISLAAVAVLATSSMVAAQTSRTCDIPDCPVMSAFGSETVTIDFTKGESDLFTAAEGSTAVTYDDTLGAVFSIAKKTDAPTFSSTKYLFYGKVDVTLRVAKGAGIVSSFVLQSDDLDEIDWEWLGGDDQKNIVQTNYFSKGDTSTYDRGANFNTNDAIDEFHTYSLDWSTERLIWSIDNVAVRTLENKGLTGPYGYPQTPMQIKLGSWCGGCSANEGTREWAGGAPDWTTAPFNGYYKSIVVQDYSNGIDNATSYSWTDSTGDSDSIKISTGKVATTTTSSSSSSTKDSTASGTQSASTTLSTATATEGITLATGGAAVNATTTSGSSSTATGSSSSSQTSFTSVSGSGKSAAANIAVMGAALFALVSL